jgi:hypothetical protein
MVVAAIFLFLTGVSAAAQDLQTRVREHQELVRQRIQEARERMAQRRTGQPTSNPYSRQYSAPSGTSAVQKPFYAEPQVVPSSMVASGADDAPEPQPVIAKPAHALAAAKPAPKPAAKPAVQERKATGAVVPSLPMKEIDTMAVTGEPPKAGPFEVGSAVWLGFWKGAIVGGLIGLIASLIVVVPMQLLRSPSMDPAKYTPATIFAIMVITGGALHSVNSAKVYDSWAKTLPVLGQILPASSQMPAADATIKMETFHSSTFGCSARLPEPVYLERKQVEGMWTTILTYKINDGALSMSFTRMPSPEEMLKQQQAKSPFAFAQGGMPVGQVIFDVEKGLDGAAKGSVDEMHGQASYTTHISNAGISGREVAGSIPEHNGQFRERIFIGGSNMYALLAVGKQEFVTSKPAQELFDSFQFHFN